MPEKESMSNLSEDATQLTPDQSELGNAESAGTTPKSTTKRILEYVLKRQRSRIVFIVGLLRCGKSSLFESLTGKKGYSGPGIHSVTEEYHLGCARIDGQFYIFVDTPGFDDSKTTSEEVFRNIVSCIEVTREHTIFTGILYVHKLDSVYSAGSSIFISWLEAFCGPQYLQFVTFVTTMWDDVLPKNLPKKLAMLEEWMVQWSNFLEAGAQIYHHGKKYTTTGHDLGIILDEKEDEDERRNQARMMMTRCYKGKLSLYPQLVMELDQGTTIEHTAAGKVLGLQPPTLRDALPEISGPNWFQMLVDLLLWPIKPLRDFVTRLMRLLPRATWRPRVGRRGFEIIVTLSRGLEIAVGWGPGGLYIDCPPDESDGEFEDFDLADELHGDPDILLTTLGNTPDEREFAEAFRQATQGDA